MKVTYNWLKEFVDFKISHDQLGELLTSIGPEVVSIKQIGVSKANEQQICLARVAEVKPHPSAGNLKLVKLSSINKIVITNSPIISRGDYVIYAYPSTLLPDGSAVKEITIKGEKSEGMLLAKQHLNLEEKSQDIFILGKDAGVAKELFDLYCSEDYLFDIELTTNRSDCLSVLGIAREISAALDLPIKIFSNTVEHTIDEIPDVEVMDEDSCPRYSARILRGVKIKESPEWMKRRLAICGIRPINNVVDVTNYVLLELGHPMHAFDLELLKDHRIVVRKAYKGEEIITLDGVKRELDEEILVIADGEKPVAVAGIMGGENSGVVDTTKDVFLESAFFDPIVIRKASKKLGLKSESSYRFERGADWGVTVRAIERATELILLTSSCEISKINDRYSNIFKDKIIKVAPEYVSEKIGVKFSLKDIEQILKRLHFSVVSKEKEFIEVKVPSFRRDVSKQIDIVEEVARIYGYNNVPEVFFKPPVDVRSLKPSKDIYWYLRGVLLDIGFTEVYNYSFISEGDPEIFKLNAMDLVRLQNPLSGDTSILRNYLFVNLLKTVNYNVKNVYKSDLRFFEFGRSFRKDNDGRINESKKVGVVMYGEKTEYYEISSVGEYLLRKVGDRRIDFERSNFDFLHPANSARLIFDGIEVGFVGEVHPDIRDYFELKYSPHILELDVDILARYLNKEIKVRRFSKFPPVNRDLSIVVPKTVLGRVVMNSISTFHEWITEVKFVDIFESLQLGEDVKSLTFSITFSNPDRTLMDDEVNRIVEELVEYLKKEFSAELRK